MKKWIKIGLLSLGLACMMAFSGCEQTTTQAEPTTSQSAENQNTETTIEEATAAPSADAVSETAEVEPVANEEPFTIGVIQLVEHGSLDAAYNGFVDQLDTLGIPYELDFQNAQNDASNLKTIAQRFSNNKVDLILAIGTPSVQAVAEETTTIPILGTAVTDYAEAKLVDTNENPGGNVSGTSDATPLKEQLSLVPILKPDAKTVGLLYTASEANSKLQINNAIKVLEEQNIAYKEYAITSTNDIQAMMQTMSGKIDVVYTPTDNTVASAMDAVAKESIALGIPVITGSTDMVDDGGTATYGLDYYELGKQTADMAKRILVDGEDISTMPIETATSYKFTYNKDIVDQLGIQLPDDLLNQ